LTIGLEIVLTKLIKIYMNFLQCPKLKQYF
jgi:hypothetical protein